MPKDKWFSTDSMALRDGLEAPGDIWMTVRWGRAEGDIQVATGVGNDERVLLEGDEVNSWHCSLDRSGINRLIRSLRHARDQAFGKDE